MRIDAMPQAEIATPAGSGRVAPMAIDAAQITKEVFPAISLRTWRAMDAGGKTPRGFILGRRKLWRLTDLARWAQLGFPKRAEYEAKNERTEYDNMGVGG